MLTFHENLEKSGERSITSMPLILPEYVLTFKNVFSSTECQDVIDVIDRQIWEKHRFYSIQHQSASSTENDLDVTFALPNEIRFIQDRLWHVINQYQESLNLYWYRGWSSYTPVRFNRYSKNQNMKTHCDHIVKILDGNSGIPSLSIVGLLNDDFEGGGFYMFGDNPVPLESGSVLIFPSNFLFPHRVENVISGTRYSFVSWVW